MGLTSNPFNFGGGQDELAKLELNNQKSLFVAFFDSVIAFFDYKMIADSEKKSIFAAHFFKLMETILLNQ